MMYARIYKEMNKYGYTFTSMQIENKMKAFEKAYKRILNKGPKKSGRGRMYLEFEEYVHTIDDIDGGFQEINDKENTFRDNDKETPVEKKIEKVRKRESAKDVRERRENEKAARQHEYLKLKRIELQLKAKKYKAKYNIDNTDDEM